MVFFNLKPAPAPPFIVVGLETAGELKTDFPDAQVTLIHSGPKIMHQMHGLGDKLRNTITQKLEAMGVKIVLNERISPPTTFQGGLELEPQVLQGATSGTSYSADVVLMTVGNSKYNSEFMHGFIEENKLSEGDVLTDEKCIKVQPTGQLEAAAFPHMFALGGKQIIWKVGWWL